jgi:hypothetical protein
VLSFWCMCTVMHVSRFVRWILVSDVLTVIMTISLSIASVFFVFLLMMLLSVLAFVSAACTAAAGREHARTKAKERNGRSKETQRRPRHRRPTHAARVLHVTEHSQCKSLPHLRTEQRACVSAVHMNWMPSSAICAGWPKMNASSSCA